MFLLPFELPYVFYHRYEMLAALLPQTYSIKKKQSLEETRLDGMTQSYQNSYTVHVSILVVVLIVIQSIHSVCRVDQRSTLHVIYIATDDIANRRCACKLAMMLRRCHVPTHTG